jgi:membrane-associated protein
VLNLIQDFFRFIYNVPELIKIVGLPGAAFIIFSETGLMVGFFLPGDSLLVTAGVLAAAGFLSIYSLVPVLLCAAVLGNATGYWIGKRAGQALYSRPNSFFFRREHLIKTHEFYERHGGKTIILAQFMPIVRTFAPVVAGAAGMEYRRFASFNVIGAAVWIPSMTLTGYFLADWARRMGWDIQRDIHLVIAVVIFLSLLPAIISVLRAKLQARRAPQPARRD